MVWVKDIKALGYWKKSEGNFPGVPEKKVMWFFIPDYAGLTRTHTRIVFSRTLVFALCSSYIRGTL
jgi:hypothetical protein